MEGESSLIAFSNVLSMTVVTLCMVMKFPQIWAALRSGDTKGISLGSVLLEQSAYSVMLSYSFAMGYPVGNYLESALLLVQNFMMLALIIHTRDLLTPKIFVFFIAYFIVYLSIGYRVVPDIILTYVIVVATPLSMFSKLAQIRELYRTKDAGRLSAATWGIAGYGCYARIITNLIQTGDWLIVVNFTSGAILNTTLVIMILFYNRQNVKKLY